MRKFTQYINLAATLSLLWISSPADGVSINWTGGASSDLTFANGTNNWGSSATPPGINDTAVFDSSASSFTPTLNTSSVTQTFTPQTILFNGSNQYSIVVDRENGGTLYYLIIGDNTTGGVTNSSTVTQDVTAQGGGQILFNLSSSADTSSSGRINYNISSNDASHPSTLSFIGASAGKANISLNTLPSSSATSGLQFGFSPGASAQQSIIDCRLSSYVIFDNNASAYQSTIALQTGSILLFNDSSDPSSTFITLDASEIDFDTTVTTTNAKVLMSNSSSAVLSKNITLNRIAADNTCTINLGSNILKTSANHEGDSLDAAISGVGGSIVKDGSTLLYMTNSSNSYSGGTSVLNGTLRVTPSSLPLNSVSTTSPGNLSFQGAGNFNGNISDNGNVSVASDAIVTLTGNITGTGNVTVDGGGDLTLTGIGNTYSNGTSISGTLHTTPANLPASGNITINSPHGILDCQGTGTFPQTMNNSGTVSSSSGSTITISGIINGIGQVVVDSGSDLTLTNTSNAYSGGTTVAGTLHVAPNTLSVAGPVTVSSPNGILDFSSSGSFSGDINNNATVEVTAPSGNVHLTGLISGTGKVEMNSTANLYLDQFNTYSGGTFVNAGTVHVTTRTLPVAAVQPSATITGSGTLLFDQAEAGEYRGDIALNSPTSQIRSDNTETTTLSGRITGTGSLLVASGKTILTNAANSYSGGSTVSANAILEGTAHALQGNITNNHEVIFNQATAGTFSGTITGPSNAVITKTGIGTATFATSQTTFQGTTNINEGTLLVNSILGGNVNILHGGTLGGIGTIVKNVDNHGIISPGNSIGTLNIDDDYIQYSDGTYYAEIDSHGNSDLINITGTATLDGALVIDLIDGIVDTTKVYTILHADGGVEDTFATVRNAGISFYFYHVSYLPQDVQLTFESVFLSVADSYNEIQVAEQLNTLDHSNTTPEELTLLVNLLALSTQPETADEARTALSQMSGEHYTNQLFIGELTGRRFIRRLYDPLRSILVNSNTCCERDVYYNCYENNCCMVLDDTPWYLDNSVKVGPWFTLSGGHTFMRHNTNAHGYQSNNYEATLGLQSTFGDIWTVGLAGSYAYESVDYNIGGTGNINTGLLGLYALCRPESYYVLADLIFDYSWGKIKRPVNVGSLHYQARSNPRFTDTLFYIEAGKDICISYSGLLLQPFLGFEVDYYAGRKIVEGHGGPINLVISKKSRTSAFSRLGLHLASLNLGCWNISCDAAWQYRMTNTRNHVRERFNDFGNTFNIKGVALPRNSLDVSAYVSTVICDGWELFAAVSAERWSRGATYDFVGGVKISW